MSEDEDSNHLSLSAQRTPPPFSRNASLRQHHSGSGHAAEDTVYIDSPAGGRNVLASSDTRRSPRLALRRGESPAQESDWTQRNHPGLTGWVSHDQLPQPPGRRQLAFNEVFEPNSALVARSVGRDPPNSRHLVNNQSQPPGRRGCEPASRFIPDMSQQSRARLYDYLHRYKTDVLSGLALFLTWSNETRKLANRSSRDSFDLAGSRGEAAHYAHFVEVNHAAAGADPEKDGRLLKLAAAYARVGYTPKAFDQAWRKTFVSESLENWSKAVKYFESDTPFPSDLLSQLKHDVNTYFKYREEMAVADFENSPVADIAMAAQQQTRDVEDLWQIYERLVRDKRMPAAQQNRMYFDLFYPFFQAVVNVDEMERPQLATRRSQPTAAASAAGALASGVGPWAPPLYVQASQPTYGPPPYGPHSLPQQPLSTPWAAYSGGQAHALSGRGAGQRGPPQSGTGNVGFVGKPVSPSVVGSLLGIPLPGIQACSHCPGNPLHGGFECPVRYFRKTGQPCPGFDPNGNRVQAAWVGGNITNQTKAAWRAYIQQHGLTDSQRASGRAVNFS